MTPDQISKLPPELRSAWDWLTTPELVQNIDASIPTHYLRMALTWCLQVVEEREQIAKGLLLESGDEPGEWFIPAEPQPLGPFTLVEAAAEIMHFWDREDKKDRAKLETAEATIATLTRERDESREELTRIKAAQENLRIMRHN